MKYLLPSFLVFVIVSCSKKELGWDDLVTRGEITYIAFTETPFTGKFIDYHDDGGLWIKGRYKNGKKVGLFESYCQYSGKLISRKNYKNGKLHGLTYNDMCDYGSTPDIVCFVEGIKEADYMCDRIYVGDSSFKRFLSKVKNYFYYWGRKYGVI